VVALGVPVSVDELVNGSKMKYPVLFPFLTDVVVSAVPLVAVNAL
jgi:hypothetical protein